MTALLRDLAAATDDLRHQLERVQETIDKGASGRLLEELARSLTCPAPVQTGSLSGRLADDAVRGVTR